MKSFSLLLQFSIITILFSSSIAETVRFKSVCFGAIPVVPHNGTGCGIPAFVNASEYGTNEHSEGFIRMKASDAHFDIKIVLKKLSKPDHVITAWLIHALPFRPNPDVFNYASVAAPLAASTAAFTTGMGREPNQFEYVDLTTAVLKVKLDYNPTYANEAPLTNKVFNYQSEIPGIQMSEYRQYNQSAAGDFVPTTSHFLRKFDPETGYEILDKKGRPYVVRGPVKPFGIAIANHLDRTTHGISQGLLGVDHYELMGFALQDKTIGSPIISSSSM